MGKRAAAIVGMTEWKPARRWDRPLFDLDAFAQLGAELLDDSGLEKADIDGFCIVGAREAPVLAPSAVAEHLGMRSCFNERVDLGGATPAGMVWRAAAAIEAGVCQAVLVLCPAIPQNMYCRSINNLPLLPVLLLLHSLSGTGLYDK